jgi:hypothetical protein
MKRILVSLFAGLLWSTSTLAESCSDKLDMTYRYLDRSGTHIKKGPRVTKADFTFKSTSNKTIKITRIGVWTSSDETVKEIEFPRSYILPFGKKKLTLHGLDEVNLDVVDSGYYSCRFEEKPITKKKKYKFKQKSWSQKMLDKIKGN